MEVGSSSDDAGNYSSAEFHEHVDYRWMVESQEEYLDLLLEKKNSSREKERAWKGSC
jgi:hypothetical protein